MAKVYLREGSIKRIAFATHITNVESITLMKKSGFSMESEFLIVSKPFERSDKNLKLENYKFEEWSPSLDEFMNLPYFKRRDNILPLAFYFQEPTMELYNELKSSGGFISINGYKGIYKYKEGPYFECIDDTFAAIDAYMNYFLLKFDCSKSPEPVTSLKPEDRDIIQQCKEAGYDSWAQWQLDYLYFVYKEQ